MKKLLLLSVIFATVAIPVRAARLPNPRQGFKKALWHMVAFNLFYLFGLYYLEARL
ncbi:MAG: hypothetical protein GX607_14245 [Myxococcales bacterium]|jgi:hypothetical protein|nr:hypothetical protein [Myxococcales bacterium]